MKVSEINNNPIAEAWKKRFSQLSEDKKLKIEELKNKKISEYQLKIIKRSKSYPEIGDIFKINPKENIYYSGIVLNNHINNEYSDRNKPCVRQSGNRLSDTRKPVLAA